MEAGQILHNNPVQFDMPEYACALMASIRDEIARVYWNVNQKTWAAAVDAPSPWSQEEGKELSFETGIPGVEWRPYYNWGGSPDDADWDQSQAEAPNFSYDGVEIRWYKRFGRSMNVNKQWGPVKWVRWFERCMDYVGLFETRRNEITHTQAVEKGNAPRRCTKCERFFNWPAKRCSYCNGLELVEYKLTPSEKRKQDAAVRVLRANRKHGMHRGGRVVKSQPVGHGFRIALIKDPPPVKGSGGIVFFTMSPGWRCSTILPCGCEGGSLASSRKVCASEYMRLCKDNRMSKKTARHIVKMHMKGPW